MFSDTGKDTGVSSHCKARRGQGRGVRLLSGRDNTIVFTASVVTPLDFAIHDIRDQLPGVGKSNGICLPEGYISPS
jgi:hypothetical protein